MRKDMIVALGAILAGIATVMFVSFLLAWPVMELWNGCLVPAVDGTREIGWLQAWGIQFLFALLFKNSTSTKKD
jgi:hypothetical protein